MRITFLLLVLISICNYSFSQVSNENIIYIVDSVPVIEDPEEGNDIDQNDIADITVVKNKDSLKLLGYEKHDGAIYLFTKEYRNRPESIKQIPSSRQMEKKNGAWLFRGKTYTGQFIDYYYSGKKQGEGTFQNGKAEGLRTMYFQNGKLSMERYYSGGIENGLEKEYYEDGTLKQKGEFLNGKEEGVWEMYFPNGQVKQRSSFKNGNMEGETTVYYSTGKILAIEVTKNGKTTPDKRLEKINTTMNKGHSSSKEGDYKNAIKNYSKAIELDSTYVEAYFSRGTSKLNEFQFDEAILDFDKALKFEPYYEKAMTNRAFARIRKHQFGNSRQISKNSDVTVLASKQNPNIPQNELTIICTDLKQAIFLGDNGRMIIEAVSEFCKSR
jgi:tetratricopeptide (TPR) repeat protein